MKTPEKTPLNTKKKEPPAVAQEILLPGEAARKKIADTPLNGVARTVVCYDNQGFRNFRILSLYIENDHIVRKEVSDPFANFECISKLELQNELAVLHLNNRWENGKALEK